MTTTQNLDRKQTNASDGAIKICANHQGLQQPNIASSSLSTRPMMRDARAIKSRVQGHLNSEQQSVILGPEGLDETGEDDEEHWGAVWVALTI